MKHLLIFVVSMWVILGFVKVELGRVDAIAECMNQSSETICENLLKE